MEEFNMRNRVSCIATVIMMLTWVDLGRAITYTTFNYPGAEETIVTGILDNGSIIGNCSIYSGGLGLTPHGFIYDGTTWSTLDFTGHGTWTSGGDGTNIVGYYVSNTEPFRYDGFLYNGTIWTTFDYPAGSSTFINGIDGKNLFGESTVGLGIDNAFIYNLDSQVWTLFDYPEAHRTTISGMDGSNIVGYYTEWVTTGPKPHEGYTHGFLYDGTTWRSLTFPGATNTYIRGIDGTNIVGEADGHSFLYNLNNQTWTTLDLPFVNYISGIEGNKIFGVYSDTAEYHSFIAIIPEPGTLAIIGLGGVLLRGGRKV